MSTYIKIGSTWHEIGTPYVKVGSTWHECTNIYVKNGSTWYEAWAGGLASENVHLGTYNTISTRSNDVRISDTALTAVAGWRFLTDGNMHKYDDGVAFAHNPTPDEWYDGTVDGTYYIKFTLTSGSAANNVSPAVGTWGALTSERYCYHSQSVNQGFPYVRNGTYQVDISTSASDTNIVETGTYTYWINIDSGQ